MDNSIFIQGIIVSSIYLLFRFIEMRFITKETLPLKHLIRDTLVVYVSFISGIFVYSQLEPIKNMASSPAVFTNNPDF
jgi:hypothetical protein